MGFFSNIWKGVKKTFKKIGKSVKKTFKSFGKFMNKIGIVGQVGIGILTGGLGFGGMLSGIGSTLAQSTLGGITGSVVRGAGWVLGKAAQFGNMVKGGFKTLTSGVTEFFGQAGKYIGGKLGMPGMEKMTMGQAWDGYSKALTENFSNFTSDVSSFASSSAFDPNVLPKNASLADIDKVSADLPVEAGSVVDTGGIPVPEEAVTSPPSLLAKGLTKTVENVGESITQVPGQMAGQALMQAIEGTPEYEAPMSMSYAPQVQFANVAGAAAAARTPLTDDQQFVQFNTPYFDGIGASNGAFGVGALYMNRLKAFSGK